MKKILLILIVISMAFAVRAEAQSAASTSDMLERVLASVVTVAVEDIDDGNMLLGFRSSNVSAAYEAGLDLRGAFGSGSGFVIERNGRKYVITNSHVIENASGKPGSVIVYSINRNRYEMDIIGGDTFYDFAVLGFRTPPGPEMVAVDYKRAEPRVGEPVYAIGNPLGEYPYTISEGIIGGMNRVRGGMTGKFGFLQSTATVIWGNSGGPLFDRNGDVIGINSQIALTRRGNQIFIQPQINFALEAGVSRRLTDDILNNNGRVRRAFVGIELTDGYQRRMAYGRDEWYRTHNHPVITGVLPGTPAAQALSQYINSRVTSINGTSVRNIEEALGAFESMRPGQRVTMELEVPGGQRRTVEFNTEELNPQRNQKIAEHLVKYDSNLSLSDIEQNRVFLAYQGTPWEVAGAGIQEDQSLTYWRVNSVNDLATSARFAGMYGLVDIVVTRPGQPAQRLRMNLSGRNDMVNCVLWY